MDILSQLKEVRKREKMSQGSVGKKLGGLPQSHISKIENAGTDPRLSTVVQMARVLDHELILVPRSLLPHIESILVRKHRPRMWMPEDGEGR